MSLMVTAALLSILGGWWNRGGRSESTGKAMARKGGEGQTGKEGQDCGWTQTCIWKSIQFSCDAAAGSILNEMKDDRTLMRVLKTACRMNVT